MTAAWDGRNRGGIAVLRLVLAVLPWVGYRGCRPPCLLVAAVVLLCAPRIRSACIAYWRRQRPGLDRTSAWGLAWRQVGSFAAILCDRGLAARGGLRVSQRGWPELVALLAEGRGAVLVSAHVGNWELASRIVARLGGRWPLHVVMIDARTPAERALTERVMGRADLRIIDPRDPIAAGLAMRAALQRGEPVCLLGDRVVPGQATATATLLGEPLSLPLGPFQLAAASGAPLMPWFLTRLGPGAYRFEALPSWRLALPARRSERQRVFADAAQRWATVLEAHIHRHPFQWHNFFDLWRQ